MKELHIEFHTDNLYKRANPLIAGKLDLYVSFFQLFIDAVCSKLQLSAYKIKGSDGRDRPRRCIRNKNCRVCDG